MDANTEPVAVFRKDAGMAILALLVVGLPSLAVLYGAFAGGFDFKTLVIGIAMAGFTALVVATSHQASVLLFNDCLVYKRLFSTKEVRLNEHTRFYHRREVHSINGVPTSRHNYLTLSEGRNRIKLNSEICDVILRDLILAFELEVTLPAALQAYGHGRLIDFDAVQLQAGTLHYKGRTLPLNEIARMTLDAGKFSVYSASRKRAFLKLDISRIANLYTLFQLLERLTKPTSPAIDGDRA